LKFANVIYVLSRLWLILGGCFLIPLAFSFYYEDGVHPIYIIETVSLFLLYALLRRFAAQPAELSIREGFLAVTLSWTSLALFGCIPFIASGFIPGFTDAYFEAMSGFTTTGATILLDIEVLPPSLLVWRNMTQWLGGMGVIALAVAVLPFLGVGGAQLFRAEVPGPTTDRISPRISQTARLLWLLYVLFTAAQTLLLMLGGLTLFHALCISFGTLATGGFVPLNASIAGYPSAFVHYVIIFFMLVAGTNFTLHFWAFRGEPLRYWRNAEFRLFYGIILVAFVVITFARFVGGIPISEIMIRDSLFQTVSVITTTGFITNDYEKWPFVTQIILLLLMFVGGCGGSTGGGIKNIRVSILFSFISSELTKLFHPRGVFPVKIGEKAVPVNIVSNVIAFIALYILLFVCGALVMTALGLDIDTAIGAVVATLGNVGPGIGDVGPVDNYGHIPAAGKWILSFLMMVGRLEIFTVLVLFTRRFWD
jgi:trk system potassium uptake protein TrkH